MSSRRCTSHLTVAMTTALCLPEVSQFITLHGAERCELRRAMTLTDWTHSRRKLRMRWKCRWLLMLSMSTAVCLLVQHRESSAGVCVCERAFASLCPPLCSQIAALCIVRGEERSVEC